MAQELFDHPLIQGLYRSGRPPSYIPSRTFALALMDIVFRNPGQRPNTIEGIRDAVKASHVSDHMKRILYVLVDDTASAIEAGLKLKENGVLDPRRLETAAIQVQERIEIWFNESMERVAGWYKRKVQAMTLGVAAVLTIALNVDTIAIVRALSADSTLRQSIVAQAESLAEQPAAFVILPATGQDVPAAQTAPASPATSSAAPTAPVPTAAGQPRTTGAPPASAPTGAPPDPAAATEAAFVRLDQQIAKLKDTALPLGWTSRSEWPRGRLEWLLKLFGLVLTIGAASLGAPFWFDVLNKIVTIRSVGKAPEETPKPPKELPRPAGPAAAPARS